MTRTRSTPPEKIDPRPVITTAEIDAGRHRSNAASRAPQNSRSNRFALPYAIVRIATAPRCVISIIGSDSRYAIVQLVSWRIGELVNWIRFEFTNSRIHQLTNSPTHQFMLVRWPDARRCELHGPAVGIAEIQAGPATRPADAAFDLDAELREARFPRRDGRPIDRKREVHRSGSVMPRHEAASRFECA